MTNEEIVEELPSIHYAMLCHTYGKLDEFIESGNDSPHADYYSCFFDIMGFAPDFYSCDYNDGYCVSTHYFSYKTMMEYYRLCRTYSRKKKISLKENPFMREAQRFVESIMDFDGDGGYAFWLQTKVNHEWASGIVVKTDENFFHDEFCFAEAVLAVGEWYKTGLERLKQAIDECEIIALPIQSEWKEAA